MPVYAATHNRDMTEGRGPMVIFAYFDNEAAALEAVRGQGVMGVGDGEVYLVEPPKTYSSFQQYKAECKNRPKPGSSSMVNLGVVSGDNFKLVYGYRKGWDGKWGYGWTDNRDAPTSDPEYKEFLRLSAKFAKKA